MPLSLVYVPHEVLNPARWSPACPEGITDTRPPLCLQAALYSARLVANGAGPLSVDRRLAK